MSMSASTPVCLRNKMVPSICVYVCVCVRVCVCACVCGFGTWSASEPRSRGRSGLGGGFASDAITGLLRVGCGLSPLLPAFPCALLSAAVARPGGGGGAAAAWAAGTVAGAGAGAGGRAGAAGRALAAFFGSATSCTGHTYWFRPLPARLDNADAIGDAVAMRLRY